MNLRLSQEARRDLGLDDEQSKPAVHRLAAAMEAKPKMRWARACEWCHEDLPRNAHGRQRFHVECYPLYIRAMKAAARHVPTVRYCAGCGEKLPEGSHYSRMYHEQCKPAKTAYTPLRKREILRTLSVEPVGDYMEIAVCQYSSCGKEFVARSSSQHYCDLNCYAAAKCHFKGHKTKTSYVPGSNVSA